MLTVGGFAGCLILTIGGFVGCLIMSVAAYSNFLMLNVGSWAAPVVFTTADCQDALAFFVE